MGRCRLPPSSLFSNYFGLIHRKMDCLTFWFSILPVPSNRDFIIRWQNWRPVVVKIIVWYKWLKRCTKLRVAPGGMPCFSNGYFVRSWIIMSAVIAPGRVRRPAFTLSGLLWLFLKEGLRSSSPHREHGEKYTALRFREDHSNIQCRFFRINAARSCIGSHCWTKHAISGCDACKGMIVCDKKKTVCRSAFLQIHERHRNNFKCKLPVDEYRDHCFHSGAK